MGNREELKKRVELGYVSWFLQNQGLDCRVESTGPSAVPDFYLHFEHGVVGLELRRVFWGEGEGGSSEKRAEVMRLSALHQLRDAYYALGGRSMQVQGSLPTALSDSGIELVARKLIETCQHAPDGIFVRQDIETVQGDIRLHALPLPQSFGEYSNWEVPENHVGWVGEIPAAALEAAIADKAKRFGDYTRSDLMRRNLLLVADRLQASGMFRFTEGRPLLEPQGFDEVFLLVHPESVHRIA